MKFAAHLRRILDRIDPPGRHLDHQTAVAYATPGRVLLANNHPSALSMVAIHPTDGYWISVDGQLFGVLYNAGATEDELRYSAHRIVELLERHGVADVPDTFEDSP